MTRIKHLVFVTFILIAAFTLPNPASLQADGSQPPLTFREVGQVRGTLNRPYDVTVGPDDRIYVADTFDHQIEIFTPSGTHIGSIGTEGKPGEGICGLEYPIKIEVSPDNKVFVLDMGLTMKVFDSSFNCLTTIPIGSESEFYLWDWDISVRNIAVSETGYVFVTTPDLKQTLVFDPQLNHVHTIEEPQFNGLAKGPENTIYGLIGNSIVIIDSNFELAGYIYDDTTDDTYKYSQFYDISVDSSGKVYVTDRNLDNVKLLIFNSDGTLADSIGETGYGDYKFIGLKGVEISSSGNILVSESYQNQVKIYDAELTYLMSLDPATYPNYQGIYSNLYISADGKIYARNHPNASISVFNPDLSSFGAVTDFEALYMIINEGPDGKIYAMADGIDEQSIRVLNPDLSLYGIIGVADEPGSDNNHFGRITDFVIGLDDRLYVADYSNHRVQVFTPDLTYYTTLGTTGVSGNDNAHFDSPYRVYFDSDGLLYVVDSGNFRIQIFDTNLNYIETRPIESYNFTWITTPNMESYGASGLTINILHPDLSLKASFDISPILDELTNGESSYLNIRRVEVADNGLIYILVEINYILVYDSNFQFLTSIGDPSQFNIFDMALDPSGNLVISDGISIKIFSPNTAPEAEPDTYAVTSGQTSTIHANNGVLANDSDAELDPLTATVVTGPSHAQSFSMDAGGVFTYVSEEGFTGQDSFTYQASDGLLSSSIVTVTINVYPAPPTVIPTSAPESTSEVTADPTESSTPELTPDPSDEPTSEVTPQPTDEPTSEVTPEPTDEPTPDPAVPPTAPMNLTIDSRFGRPQILWQDDIQAEWFRIYIGSADYSVQWLDTWIERDSYCEAGQCSVIPPLDLPVGTYHVWMQAWGYDHFSVGGETEADGWSHAEFTLPDTPPGVVEGLTYTIEDSMVSFMWPAVEHASWYNIWIGSGSPDWQPRLFEWLDVNTLHCETNNLCTLNALMAPNTYVWYVRSWGPGGFSTGGMIDAPGWVAGPEINVK